MGARAREMWAKGPKESSGEELIVKDEGSFCDVGVRTSERGKRVRWEWEWRLGSMSMWFGSSCARPRSMLKAGTDRARGQCQVGRWVQEPADGIMESFLHLARVHQTLAVC